jgi:hypothetical protein
MRGRAVAFFFLRTFENLMPGIPRGPQGAKGGQQKKKWVGSKTKSRQQNKK